MMHRTPIRLVASIALILAFIVVMLGAYTRLTHAGLGCPDWPGCYGRLVLPGKGAGLVAAQNQFPNLPIESKKAWTEMIHRYAAGTLALLIFFIGIKSIAGRLKNEVQPWVIPVLLIGMVVFQALLGMWTVTLKLLPVVVMSHLLGGMLVVALLFRLRLQLGVRIRLYEPKWRWWIRIGVVLIICQIALGGWVSSNYAGIACIGFPRCNGVWVPSLHLLQGFNLFSPVGANYEGGLLSNEVRTTIQFIHRMGAVVTAAYILLLSGLLTVFAKSVYLRWMGVCAFLIVCLQFSLGIMNVVYYLPLAVAVAHNGAAALLLAIVFSMLIGTKRGGVHEL